MNAWGLTKTTQANTYALFDDDVHYRVAMLKTANHLGINLEVYGSLLEVETQGLHGRYRAAIVDYDLGQTTGVEIAWYLAAICGQLPIVLVSSAPQEKSFLNWPASIKQFIHKKTGYKKAIESAMTWGEHLQDREQQLYKDKYPMQVSSCNSKPWEDLNVLDQKLVREIQSLNDVDDPHFFEDQVAIFHDRALGLLDTISNHLGKNDLRLLEKSSHALAGSALSIGATRLGEISRWCEVNLSNLELTKQNSIFETLKTEFNRAEKALSEIPAEKSSIG